jgi:hypothetical protein
MILVAGLAIAGLAGIAAAFYFSMRPGGSRVHASEASRAEVSRTGAGRSRTSPQASARSVSSRSVSSRSVSSRSGPSRSGGSRSGRAVDRTGPQTTVIDFTGPQRVLEDPEPPVPAGNRPENRHGRPAARQVTEADGDDAAQASRSRRRVGWRKGSDVDEELWPAEGFGGVSDEQFWDDLAADKPLATTARTAQPEAAARRRRGPLPDLHPGDGRGRGAPPPRNPASPEGAGTNPQPRLGADDRTAIQPAVQPTASPASPASPLTSPLTTQPYPVATPPSPTATQPVRAAHQPAEPRGRSRTIPSPDEDPLTSPAYSLRAKGRVDGRSSGGYPVAAPPFRQFDRPSHGPRPDPLRPDPLRSDALRPDSLRPADPYAAYPYASQPYGEPPTQSMRTPPYGDRPGSGNPAGSRPQAGPAGDPRRANGGWIPSQADGSGASNRNPSPRPAYPPVNGQRGPYDPRGNDRRLTDTH